MINYNSASGADIERIIGILQPSLIGEREDHILMACIAIALGISSPKITLSELIDGVKSVSEYIALYSSSLSESSSSDQSRMN